MINPYDILGIQRDASAEQGRWSIAQMEANSKSPLTVDTIPGRAVILGGGIAGLIAARVLSEHFAEVVVIERDPLEESSARSGLTTAALGAITLGRCIADQCRRRGHDLAGLSRRFQAELARLTDDPWNTATGEDLRHPGVEGKRSLASRLLDPYVARVYKQGLGP